jgi:hypothetical protein
VSNPAKPTQVKSFRFAAPESIQSLRLVPAHTLPGSLNLAGDLLFSFSAFTYSIFINIKQYLSFVKGENFDPENTRATSAD